MGRVFVTFFARPKKVTKEKTPKSQHTAIEKQADTPCDFGC